MKISVENYLQNIHAEQRSWVLDDDLPDDFDRWLTDLQIDEVIKYAENWGRIAELEDKTICNMCNKVDCDCDRQYREMRDNEL